MLRKIYSLGGWQSIYNNIVVSRLPSIWTGKILAFWREPERKTIVPQRDRDTLDAVSEEWARATGGAGVVVPAIFSMLHRLERTYQEAFSLDNACDALDDLAKTSARIKGNLLQIRNQKECADFGLTEHEHVLIRAMLDKPREEWPADFREEIEQHGSVSFDKLIQIARDWNRRSE